MYTSELSKERQEVGQELIQNPDHSIWGSGVFALKAQGLRLTDLVTRREQTDINVNLLIYKEKGL